MNRRVPVYISRRHVLLTGLYYHVCGTTMFTGKDLVNSTGPEPIRERGELWRSSEERSQ